MAAIQVRPMYATTSLGSRVAIKDARMEKTNTIEYPRRMLVVECRTDTDAVKLFNEQTSVGVHIETTRHRIIGRCLPVDYDGYVTVNLHIIELIQTEI